MKWITFTLPAIAKGLGILQGIAFFDSAHSQGNPILELIQLGESGVCFYMKARNTVIIL